MSDLVTFVGRIQKVLRDSCREPQWTPEQSEEYMRDFDARRARFQRLTEQLNRTIIGPRMEIVASYFVYAAVQHDEVRGCYVCRFEQCRRFPATTEISFSVDHDVGFQKLIVHMETHMTPVSVKYVEQDNLQWALDDINESETAEWVEERLLEFLDAYLRIDGEGEDFQEEPVTDPVCGMRILPSTAAASDAYHGHAYYFCHGDCLSRFHEDPAQYIQAEKE